ncbi:hypothetical protein BC936DRAFT_137211 [Jimgerdemannia flammicorona]|uniref:Uncharacterized protein n=1 Tax=Jimgerdemannia flammicorona TaxID=994334 RepID=A0A433CXX3_9FUNG|nr:hypothetical protein BC936DRAFT_137211 [Jimgerdemannia flammicorona]
MYDITIQISSVKKVYDCASTYTEEVFETAADNLRSERKRKVTWQKESKKKVGIKASDDFNENLDQDGEYEDDEEKNLNKIGASERHAATDVADKYISWEFDGEPPSWLSKAIKEYESSISEVEMR